MPRRRISRVRPARRRAGASPDARAADSTAPTGGLRIHEGHCWLFFAFDVGHGIDLDAAQKTFADAPGAAGEETRRTGISHRRRAPTYLQFHPAPLRIDQPAGESASLDFAGFRFAPRVECTLYDFGAVSVAYRIPLEGGDAGLTLESLLPLAEALSDHTKLREQVRRRVKDLVIRLTGAIERPNLVDLLEDYTVYHARRWSPVPSAQAAVNAACSTVARLLLAESGPLSPQAIEAAMCEQLSYGPADVAVIDWNAALLLDAQADDALAVLEFANVELLEMRFIDDRLDSILDRSYSTFLRRDGHHRPRSPLALLLDPHRAARRHLAALQMENAILFEGTNNALKLIGDQHLARLYALAARRFHLGEWDQSIVRKLHTADGLYQKLADEQSGRRMEVLEWIIIVLIAVSIVLPFIMSGAK
ncbi:MAG TPA: hypothetical protein VJZ71_13675 [Phycisphaerae bacterium]|nr:hypothetical protein [Phycisphaerae bacterium]